MDFVEWFKSFLCDDHSEEITLLEEANIELKANIKAYKEKAKKANHDLLAYMQSSAEEKRMLNEQINELVEDASYFEDRMKDLVETLAEAINIPDISEYLETRGIVEPFLHPELGRAENRKMVYDLEVSDLKYYTFPKDQWLKLLSVIRAEVKRILGRPSVPVNDCDNWASTMANLTHHAIRKAGLDLQCAFFFAWSEGVHAYNGFVDIEDKVWIYDPMFSDSLKGELTDDLGRLYRTTDIWFTG